MLGPTGCCCAAPGPLLLHLSVAVRHQQPCCHCIVPLAVTLHADCTSSRAPGYCCSTSRLPLLLLQNLSSTAGNAAGTTKPSNPLASCAGHAHTPQVLDTHTPLIQPPRCQVADLHGKEAPGMLPRQKNRHLGCCCATRTLLTPLTCAPVGRCLA